MRIHGLYVGTERADPGQVVLVEIPPSSFCQPQDLGRVLDLAFMIGEHWRTQEGVNGKLLDELAEATRTIAVETIGG